jgi:hypothetical protein
MTDIANMPVFDLVTHAKMIADTLDNMGMPTNAEMVREMCRRVVPVKFVPTRGVQLKAVLLPIPTIPPARPWCEQCERIVDARCGSNFCKVAA